MDKKDKEGPLSLKDDTARKKTDPPDLDTTTAGDVMNEHPPLDVAEQSECSPPEHMESYTAKDYGNEKGSAAPEMDADQDVFTIEVRGFHTSTHDDTIESFFENKKRSGGGDIKNIVIDRTNAVVHITYFAPGVAENVLKRPALTLEGAALTVSPMSPMQRWDRKTIEVHGLSPSTSYDAIMLFFESKRRSGGNTVEEIYLDTDNNIAYVTFESSEVIENVLKKNNLQLEGATLMVQPKSSVPLRQQSAKQGMENEKQQELQIVDEYSNRHTTERHERQVCDEELSTLDIPPDESKGTYAKCTEGEEHWCSNTELTRNITSKRFSEQGDPQKLHDGRTIEASGFIGETHNNTTKTVLQNRQRFEGGKDKNIVNDSTNESCLVTHSDTEGSSHITQKRREETLRQKTTPTRPPHYTPAEPPTGAVSRKLAPAVAPKTVILVSGISESTTCEMLKQFFVKKKKSGGGPLKDIDYRQADGKAVITFQTEQVARRVMERHTLKLDGADLTTKPMYEKPTKETSDITSTRFSEQGAQEPQKLHDGSTTNGEIQSRTTESVLEDTQRSEGGKTKNIVTDSTNEVGLVTHCNTEGEEPQGNLLQDRCTIEVRGFNATSDETIETFLESRRRSGGGEIKSFQIDRTNGVVLVTYCDPKVAENVLRMTELTLEGTILTASPVHRWDGKTIEVHGLKPSTSYDAIELFFESKRRSGGDIIDAVHLDSDTNIAYVTYKRPEAAERVLKKNLTLEGVPLTVRRNMSPRHNATRRDNHDSDGFVTQQEKNYHNEPLQTGDLRPSDNLHHREDTRVWTTGTEERCKHEYKQTRDFDSARPGSPRDTPERREDTPQQKMTLTRPPCDTPPESSACGEPRELAPTMAPRNVILVSGITESTTKEVLKLFFENKKRSGGGPVENIDYRQAGRATITFCSEEDAQRVMKRRTLKLSGLNLTTTLMYEEPMKETTNTPTSNRATVDMSSAQILEIRGFKRGTVRENVEMFLENTSGETELQSLDYDQMTGIAIAKFKNAEGATKLMAGRNLQLDGCQLSIVRLMDIYAGLDREACRPRAVQVEGIKQGTSQELLQLFFENRRQSGGGEIEQLDYDTDEDTAIIIFTAADSASRVAQKGSLVIEGTHIQVKLMTPPKSMPVLQGPFEDNLVLVSGLSSSCNGNDLKSFFSAVKTNCEIERVIFSLHPRVAMLQFINPPDILRMRELCVTKPLRGSMLSVQRVPQSTTIQVHNIGDVSEQILMLYFESKHSGGATVTDIKIIPEEHYALITFSECTSVQNVLAKPHHQVNKQDLHVEPFYECLGLIPPYYDTTMPGGWIPNNMVVTGFSSRVFSFLQTSDVSRRLVDTEMAKVAAVVEWRTYDDTSISVEMTCAITNTTKDAQRKAKTWSQDVSKKFLEVLETNFASDYIQTLQEAWQLFRKIISYVDELDPSMTTVDISDDACTIYVTGQRTEVVNLSAKLDKDYSKVQEEMKRAATIITETTSRHKLHQLRMLHAKAFASQLQKKFKDMKVVIDIQSQEVKFTGMPGDVMQAKLEMLEIFNKMSELKLDMSPSLINMLNGKGMRKHVVDEFRNKNICAVFNDVGGDKLGVYALSDDDVCAAVEVIKATTCEISVDAAINKMADPEKWTKLIKDQQSQHVDLLEIFVSGTAVRLVGAKSRVDAALEVIKTFLKDNIISEQFVPMEHGVASYIDKYMRNKTEKIMQDFRHSAVKITVSLDGPYGYTVSGNSYGLQSAVQQVLKIPDEVRIQQLQVDEPGMPKFLQSVSGQHSLDTLGKRHNVVIEPVGKYVQKEDVLTSKAHSAANDGFVSRVTLPGGATVEVIRGDMTKCHADAIVNAANGQLEHGGGLARAIADAGGQEIQLECRNHVQRNGVLADGQVYVSTAGRLPCKKVIHAVGPMWKDGLSNEENNLFDAVFESLLAAQQCNLSSVAIPALSSGIFGFPIVKCTMIIVSAIKDFFDTETHSSVKKVSLMDPKQDVVQTFHQSLCTVFGPKVVTTSENRQGNSQKKAPRPTPRRKEQNLMLTSMTYSRTEKQTTRHTKEKSTPVKVNHRTAEGIVLILHKSEIANEKVDAIINSTSRDLQLTRGAVSQTLLQKGGNVIQMECQENAPDGIKFAEVVVTSGGSLNCSHIVHGACCSWDGGKGQSEQVLRQFLTNCFETVHQLKLTSVAFPAIGTGHLGFPHRLVATVMLDELNQFSSRQTQTSLRDVRFVVYHKDQASIQAFEKVLKADEAEEEAEEEETRPARALEKPEQGAVGGTTSHKENEMIHIGSIDVDIVHGDLTKEETDAIVNSTSKDLDLIGATTKAIIEAGGPLIEEKMRKIGKVGSSGIAITTAGRLPCVHIIHIAAPQNGKSDWTTIIERALLEADALKIKSIAFPALGTGALGLKPSTMAAAMLDAIERFTKRNPESTLKLVKIVIFQQSMMDSFRKSAYKKASGKKGWLSSMMSRVKGFLFGEDTVAFTQQHVFNIFGKSHSDIAMAKKAIHQLCDKECNEIVLDDEKDQTSIGKMTSTQISQLRTLEESLGVRIIVMNNTSKLSIRIRGIRTDARQAQAEIVNVFRQNEMDDKDEATQVQWKYANGTEFTDYPEAINGLLENAFQSKKPDVEWKEDSGVIHHVTFKNMKETSTNNRTGVDVERNGGR